MTFLGDFFNNNNVNYVYLHAVITRLQKVQCPLYLVKGNHRYLGTNKSKGYSTREKLPLEDFLIDIGIFQAPEKFVVDGVEVSLVHYEVDKEIYNTVYPSEIPKTKIACYHDDWIVVDDTGQYHMNEGAETIFERFDINILGHIHNQIDMFYVGNSKVFTPGTSGRNGARTIHAFDLINWVEFDTSTQETTVLKVETIPYNQLFPIKNQIITKKVDLALGEFLDKANMDFSGDVDFIDIISKLDVETGVKNELKDIYDTVIS